jgi:hypothetical protein
MSAETAEGRNRPVANAWARSASETSSMNDEAARSDDDPFLIDVETDHVVADFYGSQCNREPDISLAHDDDALRY